MSLHSRFTALEFQQWIRDPKKRSFIAASSTPSLKALDQLRLADLEQSSSLLWIATSGTTQSSSETPRRWVGHTRKSLLASAEAVCRWLHVQRHDRWGRVLPLHHMGGLSIEVRSFLLGFSVCSYESLWNPVEFTRWIQEEQITLISLVPTQVFDLVEAERRCPPSLRLVIVGADRLDPKIHAQAIALGWPLLPSFGMTETASMIACFPSPMNPLTSGIPILPHVNLSLAGSDESVGLLKIESECLFHSELVWEERAGRYTLFERTPGVWTSEDYAEIQITPAGTHVTPRGRDQDFIKISGEGIRVQELDHRLSQILQEYGYTGKALFGIGSDLRRGKRLILVLTEPFEKALSLWNAQCRPIEKVSEIRIVDALQQTELGKMKRPIF